MRILIVTLVAVFATLCLAPAAVLAQTDSLAAASAGPAPLVLGPNVKLAPPQPKMRPVIVPAKTSASLFGKVKDPSTWAGNPPKFFAGAFAAFLGHETGHLIANYAMDTDPYLTGVHYGPIPFFTIEPGRYLNPHEHYITASAGFNAQNLIDEWVLTSHPNLSRENQPFLKGLASFNFWLSVGYAASAFTETGPNQRDTKGMADALGWNERWIGVMILVPTALDTYRYKHPDSKWAVVASRFSKLFMIGLSASAH
jgi:hypothetical protein